MKFKAISITICIVYLGYLLMNNIQIDNTISIVGINKYSYQLDILKSNNHLDMFLYKMAYYESRNNWRITNDSGYIGKYQFGRSALKSTGFSYVNSIKFKVNPDIWPEEQQDIAMIRLLKKNEINLDFYISKYNNTYLNDVYITKSGLLAAAHLAGVSNVKKYLNSNGTHNCKDIYGTTIEKYLKIFKNYIL